MQVFKKWLRIRVIPNNMQSENQIGRCDEETQETSESIDQERHLHG